MVRILESGFVALVLVFSAGAGFCFEPRSDGFVPCSDKTFDIFSIRFSWLLEFAKLPRLAGRLESFEPELSFGRFGLMTGFGL